MMEKYLHDTISAKRQPEIERISKADLIPAAIKHWYYVKDSLKQARLAKITKEVDVHAPVEAPKVQERKVTFDPEAEPNRKDNGDTTQKQKSPMLNPADNKNKRDSTK
jgi:penicillin-binding protein 2